MSIKDDIALATSQLQAMPDNLTSFLCQRIQNVFNEWNATKDAWKDCCDLLLATKTTLEKNKTLSKDDFNDLIRFMAQRGIMP